MKYIKTFVISKRRWLRGEGPRKSRLYRGADKKMCCLGSVGRQCGAKVSELSDMQSPYQTIAKNKFDKWPEFLIFASRGDNSVNCSKCMDINDNPLTDDDFKIENLTKIFQDNKYDLKFVP